MKGCSAQNEREKLEIAESPSTFLGNINSQIEKRNSLVYSKTSKVGADSARSQVRFTAHASCVASPHTSMGTAALC